MPMYKNIIITDKLLDRFWSKVDKRDNDECWEWKAAKSKGYGTLSSGYKKSPYKAHRLSYVIHFGAIPDEAPYICHICNNTGCVNPSHLYAGTARTNAADMVRSGRCNSSGLPAGDNGASKLTWEQVKEIRKMHLSGKNSNEIARNFPVGASEVRRIVLNKVWVDSSYTPDYQLIKSNTRNPPRLFGADNYNYKLTPKIVNQILNSPLSACALEKVMDISKPTILKVRRNHAQ